MSLYLPEQKLGSRSEPGSSSHKFMLKGRQTGGMHRGHAWVFRAESYDTMMAWFADIKELTEKSGKERDAFVRRTHARSLSGGSMKAHSIGGSSDGGMEEDEADAQPYSSEQSVRGGLTAPQAHGIDAADQYSKNAPAGEGKYRHGDESLNAAGWQPPQRPSPGGRFPSDLNVHRGLQAPVSPSSRESSTEGDRDAIAAASGLPGSDMSYAQPQAPSQQRQQATATSRIQAPVAATVLQGQRNEGEQDYSQRPQQSSLTQSKSHGQQPPQHIQPQRVHTPPLQQYNQPQQEYTQSQQQNHPTPSQFTADPNLAQNQSTYAAPAAAAGVGGAAVGAAAMHRYDRRQPQQQKPQQPHAETVTDEMDHASAVPAQGHSSPPIMTDAQTPISPITTNNTNLDPASSQGDTGSLSTVPTSYGSGSGTSGVEASQKADSAPVPVAMPQSQPILGGAGTVTLMAEPPAGLDENGGPATKPVPFRTLTSGTVSDLHIPGEYPKTPKVV
jgi:hypothetical protein